MVNHFRGRIHYCALWNEQDIGYWNPWGNPEEFGRLLKAFIPAVHETDPDAKVIFGGQADPSRDFAQRALDTCQCAAGIDVFAYHTYPGYGQNLNPEAMDGGRLRPGVAAPSCASWFATIPAFARTSTSGTMNSIPFRAGRAGTNPCRPSTSRAACSTTGPRALRRSSGCSPPAPTATSTTILASSTASRICPTTSRRARFCGLQNTNALFSDTSSTRRSRSEVGHSRASPAGGQRFWRTASGDSHGKAIVAFWMAAHQQSWKCLSAVLMNLTLKNTGIEHPVLIDVVSGEITPLDGRKAPRIFESSRPRQRDGDRG